ncbi:helix-turn-helix transcriptional regulator [Brevundimonas sp.]|uniref:helix-turn-helix transcriptional regulator n=1 Tax=Brevundimonas sp. TaxID=1871086 RepID=UPI00391D3EA1
MVSEGPDVSQSVTPSELSALIGRIYDAAIDPAAWPAAMAAICDTLGFATGVVSLIRLPEGRTLISDAVGFDPAWLARLPQYEPDLVALWGGDQRIRDLPLDRPAVLSSINPRALAPDSPDRFHREFNIPQNFIDAIAVGLSRDETAIGNIGFNRHRSAGPIGLREIEAMQLLIPHLQRAARIGRLLDAERMLASDFLRVLDGLATPVFLVAEDLRLVHANPAAHEVLKAEGAARLRDGRLCFASMAADRAVALALLASARDESQLDRKGMDVPLQVSAGVPNVLQVLPLGRRWHGQLEGNEIVGAVFMSVAGAPSTDRPALAAALFGLTAAEQRVCDGIGRGETVVATAAALGVGESTVRTHLLRVFEKTGTGRQAELAALYGSLVLPLRPLDADG